VYYASQFKLHPEQNMNFAYRYRVINETIWNCTVTELQKVSTSLPCRLLCLIICLHTLLFEVTHINVSRPMLRLLHRLY